MKRNKIIFSQDESNDMWVKTDSGRLIFANHTGNGGHSEYEILCRPMPVTASSDLNWTVLMSAVSYQGAVSYLEESI